VATGDDLYALPPREFTAARTEQVAQARAAGDKAGAAALAALKRPTVGAWLVNLVALRRPASVARLVALGEELRTAQAELAGGPAAVREVSIRRREALEAVMSDLRELVAASGETPTPQQLGEAESTFAAALADAGAAGLVRAGRVLKALTYSGFGAAPPVRASGPAAGRSDPAPAGVATPRAVPPPPLPPDDLAERRATAVAALDDARTALAAAVAAEQSVGAEVARLEEELAALRDRHAAAQSRARAARLARLAAEREVTTRERRLARLDPASSS
jgi:hypothetical protein